MVKERIEIPKVLNENRSESEYMMVKREDFEELERLRKGARRIDEAISMAEVLAFNMIFVVLGIIIGVVFL